jgi:hypothetical protein
MDMACKQQASYEKPDRTIREGVVLGTAASKNQHAVALWQAGRARKRGRLKQEGLWSRGIVKMQKRGPAQTCGDIIRRYGTVAAKIGRRTQNNRPL